MNTHARIPHISNTFIGFDKFINEVNKIATAGNTNYPPYNIVKIDETKYSISIAAAGFSENEIQITHHGDKLIIKGEKDNSESSDSEFLHRGISTRPFTRTFILSENATPNSAKFENGLLHVEIEQIIPEEQKPRSIPIKKTN
jgi:molecular chaperone IbpA